MVVVDVVVVVVVDVVEVVLVVVEVVIGRGLAAGTLTILTFGVVDEYRVVGFLVVKTRLSVEQSLISRLLIKNLDPENVTKFI